jgi:hypothetical protein
MILQRRIGDAAGIGYSNTVLCARCKCHDGNVTAAAIGAAPLEVGPECQNRWKKWIPVAERPLLSDTGICFGHSQ